MFSCPPSINKNKDLENWNSNIWRLWCREQVNHHTLVRFEKQEIVKWEIWKFLLNPASYYFYEMLHLTNFFYHLGLEELGVQEFIDEKHFKGGKLIQISWANSANFVFTSLKKGRFTLVIFRRSMQNVN